MHRQLQWAERATQRATDGRIHVSRESGELDALARRRLWFALLHALDGKGLHACTRQTFFC